MAYIVGGVSQLLQPSISVEHFNIESLVLPGQPNAAARERMTRAIENAFIVIFMLYCKQDLQTSLCHRYIDISVSYIYACAVPAPLIYFGQKLIASHAYFLLVI